MSRANSITIGQEVFPSKKALTDKVRSILYAYDPKQTLNIYHHHFMDNLLDRHPNADEKRGKGIKSFYVERNEYGGLGFYIERVDNSHTDFSFTHCITNKTPRHDLLAALREEIKPQIFEARDAIFSGDPVRCPFSGEVLTKHGCHIDHTPPDTFEAIANEFIATEELILVAGYGDMEESKHLSDEPLRQRWLKFHKVRAHLRAVSRRANLSDVKKGL